MPSILKVDQLQSDSGTVNLASNIAFTGGAAFVGNIANPTITGTLNLIGGQIKFPATQLPSTDGNTLDDYEEGTWTPDIKNNSSSSTFTSKVGTYTKIGRLVYCSFVVDFGNTGTSGSDLILSGLPFAFGGSSNIPTLIAFTANGIPSAIGCYLSRTSGGSTSFFIREAAGSNITTQLTFAAGTIIYEV